MPCGRWMWVWATLSGYAVVDVAAADCMPIREARAVAVSGPAQLLVDSGSHGWLLTLATECPAALGAQRIRFLSGRQDRQICAAGGDRIEAGNAQCTVDMVQRVPADVVAAGIAQIRAAGTPPAVALEVNPVTDGALACFNPNQVQRWHQVDRLTVEVQVRREGKFRLHLANTCRELADTQTALFHATYSQRFCGRGVDRVVPLNGTPRLLTSRAESQGCPVARVERLPDPVAGMAR